MTVESKRDFGGAALLDHLYSMEITVLSARCSITESRQSQLLCASWSRFPLGRNVTKPKCGSSRPQEFSELRNGLFRQFLRKIFKNNLFGLFHASSVQLELWIIVLVYKKICYLFRGRWYFSDVLPVLGYSKTYNHCSFNSFVQVWECWRPLTYPRAILGRRIETPSNK